RSERPHLLALMLCRFFLHHPPTTEIYTLSLHDALPIWRGRRVPRHRRPAGVRAGVHRRLAHAARRRPRRPVLSAPGGSEGADRGDRKSTRLNSSHVKISYAVFCLKKKK